MGGFEPPTCCLRNSRSDQLSYTGRNRGEAKTKVETEVKVEKPYSFLILIFSLNLFKNRSISPLLQHYF